MHHTPVALFMGLCLFFIKGISIQLRMTSVIHTEHNETKQCFKGGIYCLDNNTIITKETNQIYTLRYKHIGLQRRYFLIKPTEIKSCYALYISVMQTLEISPIILSGVKLRHQIKR